VGVAGQTDLHYELAGQGPPVVLLHEGIADSRMWEPQWRTFPPQYRVARYDMRGFGESPAPSGSFSHARDLVELLDGLALGPAALVGVSMGGAVALDVTIDRPELVSALVLVGSGLRGHEFSPESEAGWAEEETALERGDLDAAVEVNLRMWVDGPHRSPEDVDRDVRRRVGEMQRRAFELWQSGDPEATLEPLDPGWQARLGEIRVPTLIVVGELDRPEMHEIADRLEAAIPNTRRALIEGTAHVPSMERPTEFDELVLGFLAEAQPA
jgi:pimeloyl-ACP methyl ester carboxylesterase